MFRHTGWKKFIGLCNGPVNMIKDIEKILKVKEEDHLDVKIGGINHMIYALDIQLNGKNANRNLIDTMINDGNKESLKNIVDLPWSNEFLNSYGYLGIGYLRYYLQKQQMLEHCQG